MSKTEISGKHTPGPWKVGNGDVYAEGNKSSDFDDIVICAIGQSGGFRSHEYAVVKAHKPEGRANARLIAAAPELLIALEDFDNWFCGFNPDDQASRMEGRKVVIRARDAIARATGQSVK